jgi:hypothetical protein
LISSFRLTGVLNAYLTARRHVREWGFGPELEWQTSRIPEAFTESDFLRECGWVILCSGFRESVVRRVFPYVSLCFCDWESASAIASASEMCIGTAMAAFGNVPKLRAIVQAARNVERSGFQNFKMLVLADPVAMLMTLPFLGPTTSLHLAKNLGIRVAKPDRHLKRVASVLGFRSPQHLCSYLSDLSGDPVPTVDIVLWRFLEHTRGDVLALKGMTLNGGACAERIDPS